MAEPLNATFFAFRKREKSGVLTRTSLAFLALAILLLVAFVAVNFQAIGPIFGWYGQIFSAGAKGPSAAASSMMTPPPAGFVILFLSLLPFMFGFYLLFAAYEAACLRWLIRGQTGNGFMGLSLGADTWRVYLNYWIWFGLYMAYSMVSGIIFMVMLFGSFAGARGGTPDMSQFAPMLAAAYIVRLLMYLVLIYFAVRLAPASAVTVAKRQFAFFDAWAVTKGRFWALFGSFFLVFLIAIAIEIVLVGVVLGVAMAGAWTSLVAMGPNPSAEQVATFFGTLFTPQNLLVLCGAYVVLLALTLVFYVILYGINARAVIAAAEEGKIEAPGIGVAEQFS